MPKGGKDEKICVQERSVYLTPLLSKSSFAVLRLHSLPNLPSKAIYK